MALTLKQLQNTAALAYLDSKDAEALLSETTLILNHIDHIHKIDVTGVEPLVHPIGTYQFLRDDVILNTNCAESLAEVAPAFIDDHYIVPKHLKEQ